MFLWLVATHPPHCTPISHFPLLSYLLPINLSTLSPLSFSLPLPFAPFHHFPQVQWWSGVGISFNSTVAFPLADIPTVTALGMGLQGGCGDGPPPPPPPPRKTLQDGPRPQYFPGSLTNVVLYGCNMHDAPPFIFPPPRSLLSSRQYHNVCSLGDLIRHSGPTGIEITFLSFTSHTVSPISHFPLLSYLLLYISLHLFSRPSLSHFFHPPSDLSSFHTHAHHMHPSNNPYGCGL